MSVHLCSQLVLICLYNILKIVFSEIVFNTFNKNNTATKNKLVKYNKGKKYQIKATKFGSL